MNTEDLLAWRLLQDEDFSDLCLDSPCKEGIGENCEVHTYLHCRFQNVLQVVKARGYSAWFVPCPTQAAGTLPCCIDRCELRQLPELGNVHSIWHKGESVLVTYQSGLHIWHKTNTNALPSSSSMDVVGAKSSLVGHSHPEERLLFASEMRRAIDQNDTLRYGEIWRAEPMMEAGVYCRKTDPVFKCFEILYSSTYEMVLSSTAADERTTRYMAAVQMAWAGGAIGRSRPAATTLQNHLWGEVKANSSDPFEQNAVEHAQMYTLLMLSMTSEPCCIALSVVIRLGSFTDDHSEHTTINEDGIPLLREVVDTFRQWRSKGAWTSLDAVIGMSMCNELMRELQLYRGQLSYRPTNIPEWYSSVLLRAVMLGIHPIVEMAASVGDMPVSPHHFELAQMAAVISHDLLDERYDVSKGVCLNSIYALSAAMPEGGCHECVAECLSLLSVHILLATGTSAGIRLATLVAGAGVPRSYAFGMFRDLLNARGAQLEARCTNAWRDAVDVLEECVPGLSVETLRSSNAEYIISSITTLSKDFVSMWPRGDTLIKLATDAATSDTSSAETINTLWRNCIDEFHKALAEYLEGDARRLAGLTWSAFIHGSQARISMRAGSIRHAENCTDRVPDWQVVVSGHTEVPF